MDDFQNPNANFGQTPYPPPPKKSSNWLLNIFLGCGCLFAFMSCAIGIGVWYVAANFRGLAADALSGVLVQAINESELPADQKQRLTARINQLKDDYKGGKISDEKMIKILESIGKSPILPAGSAYMADEKYIKPSGLTDEEKAAGRQNLQRLVRGVVENKISQDDLEEIMEPISESSGDGKKFDLKEKVTDEELKEFLQNAKDAADEAMIPDEPFTINVADEFDKAIDKAMQEP